MVSYGGNIAGMETAASKVARLKARAMTHLDELTAMYDTPVKATLLIRDLGRLDGGNDIMISDDDPAAAARAITRLRQRGPDSHRG